MKYLRDLLVAAAFSALAVLAWQLLFPGGSQPDTDIEITALGTKNPQSQGTEVWFHPEVSIPGMTAEAFAASMSNGEWELRDKSLVSYKGQPATLSWSGPVPDGATLTFTRHGWSGHVRVTINGTTSEHDLFDANRGAPNLALRLTEAPGGQATISESISRSAMPAASSTLLLFTILSLARAARAPLAPSVAETRSHVMILAAATLGWTALTLYMARTDVPAADVPRIFAYVGIVVLLQACLIQLFYLHTRVLSSVAMTANMFLCNVVFSTELMGQPTYLLAAFAIATLALNHVLMDLLVRLRALRLTFFATLAIFCVFVLASFALGRSLVPPSEAAPSETAFEGVRMVDFERTPNVYFLSFDAMIPEVLAQEYLGFRPTYLDAVAASGAHVFANMFADGMSTKMSFTQILKLRPDASLDDDDLVTGNIPSALRQAFKHNGYRTYFVFTNTYFGLRKGVYLDEYVFHDDYTVCSFLAGSAAIAGFFGYCPVQGLFMATGVDRFTPSIEMGVRLLNEVTTSSDDPTFYMQHFLFPGHTWNNVTTEQHMTEFVEAYRENSVIAAQTIDTAVGIIRTNDPSAIILLYSDHGSWTSRAVSLADDPRFYVQDKFGILAGIINADMCLPYFRPPEGQSFQTNARIAAALIQCLAGGQSPLSTPFDHNVIPLFEGKEKYQDYVYE
ncbi:hypothetical protein [Arvimicrobium flavum]|uniref:hypothetical protein n=1 Tax=Arvimicrobium flavum TaxID=3393320 RepID=UPI00237A3DE4|nr:hypothetical protein [Mesorhizobium shangrilense]